MSKSDPVLVICPSCSTPNRVPRGKLAAGGKCGRCSEALFAGNSVNLTAQNFDAHLLKSGIPLVVDFWAAWCGPCRQMAPAFEAAAAKLEPDVRLGKLDVESEQAIANRFGIRAIPTMVLFVDGREVARQAGSLPPQVIAQWIRQSLNDQAVTE